MKTEQTCGNYKPILGLRQKGSKKPRCNGYKGNVKGGTCDTCPNFKNIIGNGS